MLHMATKVALVLVVVNKAKVKAEVVAVVAAVVVVEEVTVTTAATTTTVVEVN